jgi:acylphosphatase
VWIKTFPTIDSTAWLLGGCFAVCGANPMSASAIRHVTIRGRVQGVGYRAWTEHMARSLGLEGWVRNRRDGAVEAVFAGPAAAVAQMIEASRCGPPSAQVQAVEERAGSSEELALRGCGGRFAALPTV